MLIVWIRDCHGSEYLFLSSLVLSISSMGQLCAESWVSRSRPAATEPGLEPRISSGTASTAMQGLRPLPYSGGISHSCQNPLAPVSVLGICQPLVWIPLPGPTLPCAFMSLMVALIALLLPLLCPCKRLWEAPELNIELIAAI